MFVRSALRRITMGARMNERWDGLQGARGSMLQQEAETRDCMIHSRYIPVQQYCSLLYSKVRNKNIINTAYAKHNAFETTTMIAH
jgi:hypothetical protein